MQAESANWIWVDERCSEEIYSELIARTSATDGILFLSYTPLKGGGQLTYRFLNEYSPDRCDIRITGADAKDISPARREELAEAYLEHEKTARLEGIPKSWARFICGVDFGYGHPFAATLCAWVHDSEEFFVIDGFKMERSEAPYHVKRIAGMCRGLRIPIAWPHDGYTHEKGSGMALADVYRRVGVDSWHGADDGQEMAGRSHVVWPLC
jgi:phage terminase large subunit-like protein